VRRLPLLVLLPLVALAGCRSGGPTIQVASVGRADVVEVVEAPATVVARATTTLSAPADGRVVELRVRDGQSVRAGQVLAVLDSPTARARLADAKQADAEAASGGVGGFSTSGLSGSLSSTDAAAQRSFAAAREAALQIADANARQQALAALATASAQYAAARAQAASALAALQRGIGSLGRAANALSNAQRVQTRAAVSAAQSTVDALTVAAPLSGVVSLGSASAAGSGSGSLLAQLPADLGALLGSSGAGDSSSGGAASGASAGGSAVAVGVPVQAGAPLLTVTDLSTLSLTAEVDETDVFLVKPGVRASVELDAVPGADYDASVVSVDLSPATSARGGVTYRVRLGLGAGRAADGRPAPRPRPGMSAVADLRVREAKQAVAVPAAAVIRDGDRDAVWMSVNGKAVRRLVGLGAEGDDWVQVVSGLAEGDRVVVHGADAVRAGQKLPR
jgi:multidrug efflux pump subunit AcrA (membrane-fusion protein)